MKFPQGQKFHDEIKKIVESLGGEYPGNYTNAPKEHKPWVTKLQCSEGIDHIELEDGSEFLRVSNG